jgi:DNA-binding CsgD family transcriptional regulator
MLRLCNELHSAADSVSQKHSLLAGLCDLLDAEAGVSIVAHVAAPHRRQHILSVVRHGATRISEKQLLSKCIRNSEFISRNRFTSPSAPLSLSANTLTWNPLPWPARPSRGRRLQHCLWAPSASPDVTVVACVCITRAPRHSRPFLARERVLLDMTHSAMSWIYQPDLFAGSVAAVTLSPRQRQTLQLLLAGRSEKEIAELMQLSRNTVHHHVKALHRRFKVSSRSELLAKWVRSDRMESE